MKHTFTISKKLFAISMAIIMMLTIAVPFASAATLLDVNAKVSITLNCSKQGYQFEVYQVASLDNKATTTYETVYTPFFDDIANSVKTGVTKDILSDLDNLSTMPAAAANYGIFNSSTESSKTFDNLEQGIYYIKTITYPAGVKRVENSVVALPYYSNGWVYSIDDIQLAEKVQDDIPATHKEITNSTKGNVNYTDVSLGDTVEFKLTNTTAGSASIKLNTYTVYDDMSKGLTLDKNTVAVYLADIDGNKLSNLAKGTDYKLNITKEKAGENTTFNVALTEDFLAKDNFYQSNVVSMIVTYTAKLNEYAVKGIAGNPNEDVELEYGNTSTIDTVPGNTVYVYTYGVLTNKFDESGAALAGATFGLYKTEADAEAKTNILATGTSDSTGKVSFLTNDNVEINLTSGNYYIAELEAPEGYNVYAQIIPITIDVSYNEVFNETWVQNAPADGYAICSVTDTAVVLPQTGGMIKTVYIVGGICLAASICLLGVLFALKKKKAANKANNK